MRTACLRFHQAPPHSLPCRKGPLAAPTFPTSPLPDSHCSQSSKQASSSRSRENLPHQAKRQQAARTPKPSLGVRTACLRFHQGPPNSLPCRKGPLAAPTLRRPPLPDSNARQSGLLLSVPPKSSPHPPIKIHHSPLTIPLTTHHSPFTITLTPPSPHPTDKPAKGYSTNKAAH